MRPWSTLLPLFALACSGGDPDIAIAIAEQTFRADLDAGVASRSIDVVVDAPTGFHRTGEVGVSLRIGFDVVIPPRDPFIEVGLDGYLFGRSVDEVHQLYPSEGAYRFELAQPTETECASDERCQWRFDLRLERVSGQDDIHLQGQARAILNLGPEDEVPADLGPLELSTQNTETVEIVDSGDTDL